MADTRDLIDAEICEGIFELENNPAREGKTGFITHNVLATLGLIYSKTKPAQPGYYWWDGDGWADPQVVLIELCFEALYVKGRDRDQRGFYRPLFGLGGRFADCPKPPESEEVHD